MIVGRTVKLRALEWGDQLQLVEWRNDLDVHKWFFEYEPQSFVKQKEWFEHFLQRGDEKLFMITTLDDHPLGTIGLTEIDMRSRKAYLGRFYIGSKEDRGKTYGPEAEWLLLQYCFDHLNLNRVYCEVFAFNRTVISLHKAFGFKEEGVLREDIFHQGLHRDVVVMGLLWSEYEKVKVEVQKRLEKLFQWVANA